MTESDDQDISMDDDEQSLASIPNFIRKEEQIAEFVKEAGENFKMKCEMYEKLYEANVAMNDLVSSRLTRLEMDIEMPSLVHYFMRIFVISRHYTFGVGLDKLVENDEPIRSLPHWELRIEGKILSKSLRPVKTFDHNFLKYCSSISVRCATSLPHNRRLWDRHGGTLDPHGVIAFLPSTCHDTTMEISIELHSTEGLYRASPALSCLLSLLETVPGGTDPRLYTRQELLDAFFSYVKTNDLMRNHDLGGVIEMDDCLKELFPGYTLVRVDCMFDLMKAQLQVAEPVCIKHSAQRRNAFIRPTNSIDTPPYIEGDPTFEIGLNTCVTVKDIEICVDNPIIGKYRTLIASSKANVCEDARQRSCNELQVSEVNRIGRKMQFLQMLSENPKEAFEQWSKNELNEEHVEVIKDLFPPECFTMKKIKFESKVDHYGQQKEP